MYGSFDFDNASNKEPIRKEVKKYGSCYQRHNLDNNLFSNLIHYKYDFVVVQVLMLNFMSRSRE